MSPPLLAVEHLSKAYGGVHAVQDVSFTLAAGELLAMIGPNGAGKSTCFNMLNGQVAPDAGQVAISGRDVTGLPPRQVARLGIGRTFQITATFPSMTVRENVQVALLAGAGRMNRLAGHAGASFVAEADELCRLVGMGHAAGRPAGELAYGDLKRLELAVALANKPVLLLMDEPTAGMAPAERVEMMRLTADIARESSLGVLFTEHDMDVVFEHADRVIVLDRGRIIAEGTPAAIRENPAVRATYLGEGLTFGHAPAAGARAHA
ncbi:ABC transporter ATP-binding protein [Enterovirga sp.]|uniref:ABC transporter ATP-binding protein n=1 Tax=Enterovirga sp. TaxID=2026350 RepID=UPI00262FA8E8|nr:ABC transporter ATP-binding protein [Enterovirga sp.]MDB5590879.1 transporter ATP-binding protein [Enterovirga sp.]